MKVKLFLLICIAVAAAFFPLSADAQILRKSVSAAEVNGTFRLNFTGKYKGSYNEIKILALGKNKLRVSFDLVYPYTTGAGELSANVGTANDIAEISGDTAIFTTNEFGGECKIVIKFLKPGTIRVSQSSTESACGFGNNVTADGTYKNSAAQNRNSIKIENFPG